MADFMNGRINFRQGAKIGNMIIADVGITQIMNWLFSFLLVGFLL